jgi:hypothetical protein
MSEHRSERQRVRSGAKVAMSVYAKSGGCMSEHRSERQRVRSGASSAMSVYAKSEEIA